MRDGERAEAAAEYAGLGPSALQFLCVSAVPQAACSQPSRFCLPSVAPLAGLAGYLAFPTTARSDIMLSFGEDDLLIQVRTTVAQQGLG